MNHPRRDRPLQILLVEDSASDAQLLCEALGSYSLQQFRIEQVKRLEEALALVTARAFDVILLDLNLPDSRGLETCKRMSRAAGQAPILVLTGADDEATAAEAMHLGVQDYLVKGQTQGGVLGRTIRYAVERSQTQAALRAANERLQQQAEELQSQAEELQTQTEELATANEELRTSEQALHEAEERLHRAMESGKVGVWEWEPGTEHVEWSQGYYRLLGYEPEEITPTREALRRRVHPQDLARQEQTLRESLQRCEDYVCEFRVVWADGSVHWVEARGQYAYGNGVSGPVLRMRGVLADIDQRKQAEERLRESETRYRSLFENMLDGYAYCRMLFDEHDRPTDFVYLDVNDAFGRLTGLQNVIGKKVSEVIPGIAESYPELLEIYGRVALAGQPERLEIELKPLGMWLSIGVYSPERGYFTAVFENITARKRAEETLRQANEQLQGQAGELQAQTDLLATANAALRQSQEALRRSHDELEEHVRERTAELLHANEQLGREVAERERAEDAARQERQRLYDVLELLPAYVILLTPDHQVPFANRFFRERFGDSCGRRCFEYLFGRTEPCEICGTYKVLETHAPVHWEWTGPDGRVYDISDFPFTDVDGSPLIMEMGIDITERKRAEEASRQANEALEHRARQLQKLTLELSEAEERERQRLAEILHDDLQQVLAAAKFHLGLMKNRTKYNPAVQTAATQIDQMLKDAIDKSRSLSHELSPAVLHHGDFAETLGWLAAQVKAKHGLEVRVDAVGEVKSQSDALKAFLYRAAQELLFNVVKHARVREARLRIRRRGRYLCLSVSDRGRGFDPQEIGETAGFGLLSIRERVALLGGRMRTRSAKGRGATFHIIMPDAEPCGKTAATEPRSSGRGTPDRSVPDADDGRLRVLLADDHEIVRQGVASLLSEEPTVRIVGEATNGREAVDLANELRPDVVVMDVSMPLMNGDEATRQIKKYLPRTRIVALSMHEQTETVENMRRAGADSYVLKTAPSEELLAAIRGKQADE